MADLVIDGCADTVREPFIIEWCRHCSCFCSDIIYPAVNFCCAYALFDMFCNVIQYGNIDLRAFFDPCDLFRSLNDPALWNDPSLSLQMVQLIIKRSMAFFIFFSAAAPARVISS